jgi:hypothetical protein
MTAKSMFAIRNRSKVEQYVFFEGERHSLRPFETQVVDPELGRQFIEACTPHVVKGEGLNTIEDAEVWSGERTMLYNTTGNPDAPDTIVVWDVVNKQRAQVEVPNPNKKPRIIQRKMEGGSRIGSVKGERTSIPLPAKVYYLYPYTRKSFPKPIADWILNRDALGRQPGVPPAVAHARDIEADKLEADDDWSLDDLRLYGSILDGSMTLGPDEEQALKWVEKGSFQYLEKYFGRPVAYTKNVSPDRVLRDLIKEIYHRVFFRMVDPQRRLPTQKEFDQAKGYVKDEQDGTAPRGRGRPRKDANFQPTV